MYHSRSHSSYSSHKRGMPLPFFIVRLFISLIIFAIFGFGIYKAIVHFSGIDPIGTDPEKIILETLTSDKSASIISKLFNVNPQTLLGKSSSTPKTGESQPDLVDEGLTGNKILTFAVVGDSHNNNEALSQALEQAREAGAKFVIGVGDYSDVGTNEELSAAKKVFENSGLPYYLTAGDHDLWNGRDKGRDPDYFYKEVFGPPYQSFGDSNIRFIIVYNSENYFGVDELQMRWLEEELVRVVEEKPIQTFVFLHEPLYHPSSDHVMGKTNPKVAEQAQFMLRSMQEAGVGEIIAGDAHFYGRYTEPNTGLKMTVNGSLSQERNIQTPRFLLVDVGDNGSYNITDTEVR